MQETYTHYITYALNLGATFGFVRHGIHKYIFILGKHIVKIQQASSS